MVNRLGKWSLFKTGGNPGLSLKMQLLFETINRLTLRIPRVLEPHRITRGEGRADHLLSHNSLDLGT